ncbi:MAG TPA: long-chain fatty acid--CoA ligase [Gemmatimonadales bacterium]|nr:long-chain fatty acid--CoA ligase [Gemmatimonadales bacterium]
MAEPRTLTELFFGAIDANRGRPAALRHKVNGRWVDVSHAELLERVQDVSIGLWEQGIARGDRVAILSENRPEWAIADYACLALGAADVPIYPTLPPKQIEHLLHDSGAVAVFVSTAGQLAKVGEIRARLPALRAVIAFDGNAAGDGAAGGEAVRFAALAAQGRAARERHAAWRDDALAIRPDDLATLIYTSGTTGDPKGVMLTHGNIATNVLAALAAHRSISAEDECLSVLPLSHIFERTVGHYSMLHAGVVINYATSAESVGAELIEVRPTLLAAVPRLYEKIFQRVLDGAASGSALTRFVFRWARLTGEMVVDHTLAGRPLPPALAIQQRLADRLVFAKLRERTGGRLRILISGGAPLEPGIIKFFHAAGLPILEGYGLTETSPVIAVNSLDQIRIGTVGPALRGVEVRIADDGEILTRGPHVMRGYYNDPGATGAAIDGDGWFHTGDIGVLDGGFLRITDRKKDLIVTAGGKNIAPQPIEAMAKTSPLVANAVLLGDRRKFPVMLVVPHMAQLKVWAAREGLTAPDDATLLALPAVVERMNREVRATFRDLAPFETPKKLLLLPADFTIESGELTPTLKVKRRVVERNHAAAIEALYRA